MGYGKIVPRHIIAKDLGPVKFEALAQQKESKLRSRARAVRRLLGGDGAIVVRGVEDLMVNRARCCSPLHGEDIIGYITRGRGVSVHSLQCQNVVRLMYDTDRRIDVEWDQRSDGTSIYDVKLALDVEDRQGLLAKIVSTIADEKTNIRNVDAKTFEGATARVTMVLAVADRTQMERVMARIRKIDGVREVERIAL